MKWTHAAKLTQPGEARRVKPLEISLASAAAIAHCQIYELGPCRFSIRAIIEKFFGKPVEEYKLSPTRHHELKNGGEGGIRTHGTRKGSTVFETARFNHSRTSPTAPQAFSTLAALAALHNQMPAFWKHYAPSARSRPARTGVILSTLRRRIERSWSPMPVRAGRRRLHP